jgi:hypothetical protein
MKANLIRAFLTWGAIVAWPAVTQADIAGYVRVSYPAGDNLLGNPLAPASNSIKTILTAPAIPAGSTFQKWDATNMAWSAPSVFNGSVWSLDYNWSYGEGAWLHLPSAATNLYVGRILGTPPRPPTNAGVYLLAAHLFLLNDDLATALNFESIVGRAPREGESVRRLDAVAQTYLTTTYTAGAWNKGVPGLALGESAFFNLGPVPSYTITGLVELEEFTGIRRDVTFVVTGGAAPGNTPLRTNVVSLEFTNPGSAHARQAAYALTVPANTSHLSARTDWNLRRRLDVVFTNNATVIHFTGDRRLRAGDLDGSNTVDLGDYSALAGAWYTANPAADLDGNGRVDWDDYFLLAHRWQQGGDPE